MQIELYNAFMKAGLSDKEARECVDSLRKEIKQEVSSSVGEMKSEVKFSDFSTKKDLLDLELRLVKWYIATQIATLGFIFAFLKYFFHG